MIESFDEAERRFSEQSARRKPDGFEEHWAHCVFLDDAPWGYLELSDGLVVRARRVEVPLEGQFRIVSVRSRACLAWSGDVAHRSQVGPAGYVIPILDGHRGPSASDAEYLGPLEHENRKKGVVRSTLVSVSVWHYFLLRPDRDRVWFRSPMYDG